MTLIFHFPYKNGVVIVADKQETYFDEDGKKVGDNITEKTLAIQGRNYAIALAGRTKLIEIIINKLVANEKIVATNIVEYIQNYAKNNIINEIDTRGEYFDLKGLEIFLVLLDDRNITSIEFLGTESPINLYRGKYKTIGGATYKLSPHLGEIEFNYDRVEKDDAIDFCIACIDFFSEYDNTISIKYGIDIITIDEKEGIKFENRMSKQLQHKNLFDCVVNLLNKTGGIIDG